MIGFILFCGFFGLFFFGVIFFVIFGSIYKYCFMLENVVFVEKVKRGRVVGYMLFVRCYFVVCVWYCKN